MTTEPTRPASPRVAGGKAPSGPKLQPGGGVTSLELRLYVITVLAAVYIVSWRVITAGSTPSADPPLPTSPPAISRKDTPVAPPGIDEVTRRPSYTVPAGWHVVSWDSVRATPSRRNPRGRSPTVVRAPERSAPTVVRAPAPKKLVRAPASRRVRTRSS